MIPFYIGFLYFTYWAFSPLFQMTETTQGNLSARVIVLILAWNMNLKSFWFGFPLAVDIFIGD
jgi:hypothetical protein